MNKSDKTDMQVIGKSNQNNNRNDEKLQKELLTTLQRDIRDYYTYLIISVVVAIFMLFSLFDFIHTHNLMQIIPIIIDLAVIIANINLYDNDMKYLRYFNGKKVHPLKEYRLLRNNQLDVLSYELIQKDNFKPHRIPFFFRMYKIRNKNSGKIYTFSIL